ncbi:MAG: efflux RND transporter periplasmic adaptor subunit [bacterium]|nr:efflux RND transporter periplasmic adaptor subunit [bacterium]
MSRKGTNRVLKMIGAPALIALTVLVSITTGCSVEEANVEATIAEVQAREGMPVDYITVRSGALEDWRRFTGVAEGEEQVDLVAGLRARVISVNAELGDLVSANSVLVSLDTYEPATASLNLESLRAGYETARIDSLRLERLHAQGAVSAQDLDHVRTSCVQAGALLRTALRAVEIDTPISGLLTALHVEIGDFTASGEPVATVASFDRIRVPLFLSQSERDEITKGQLVRLELPTGETLMGQVVKVALSADPETRLYGAEVLIENPGHVVKPGSLVNPEILIERVENAPLLPSVALTDEGVFVLNEEGGRHMAELRPVSLGIVRGDLLSVAEGLVAGDQVVVWGHNRLKDGLRAKPVSDLTTEYYGASRED